LWKSLLKSIFAETLSFMRVKILLFGIIAEIIDHNSLSMELEQPCSVARFKEQIFLKYPKLKNYATFAVAINEEYAEDSNTICNNDTIALIPPVSGG